MSLDFLPQPKRVRSGRGRFTIPRKGAIGIVDRSLYPVADRARAVFVKFDIAVALDDSDPLTIALADDLKPGGYRLKVAKDGVRIEADNVAAAAHAVSTLEQLAEQSPKGTLREATITDWPDFPVRGVYYDQCRGRVSKIERLMEQIDLLADYKINHLQYYIEHTFRFRRHPLIGKNASPLTAEDLMELDDYARDRNIELVPSLASFGHMGRILPLKPYRHLAEDWGVGKYVDPEASKHRCIRGWTLSPANPEIYDFLESLFEEFLPCFSSDQFNVCCDETWDLGLGQSYELAQKKGKGRVYLDHIIRLNEMVKRHGKRMMMWGDIVRKHPDLIPDIPKDVTVLDWGYSHNHDFKGIAAFAKVGLPFYACPGTNGWGGLFPRLPMACANIAGYAREAEKNGATGLLNTDWGDGGHYNFMEFSWHGYLFGAEQAWNRRADRKTFTRRFCKHFLKVDSGELAQAIDRLGDVATLSGAGGWRYLFFAAADDAMWRKAAQSKAHLASDGKMPGKEVTVNAALGRETVERLGKIRAVVEEASRTRGADPHKVLPYWLFAIDTLTCAARKLAVLGEGGDDSPQARRELKKELRSLKRRFEKLWHARNRKSEIQTTLKRYDAAIESL